MPCRRGEAYPVLCPWGVLTDGGVRCRVVEGRPTLSYALGVFLQTGVSDAVS